MYIFATHFRFDDYFCKCFFLFMLYYIIIIIMLIFNHIIFYAGPPDRFPRSIKMASAR